MAEAVVHVEPAALAAALVHALRRVGVPVPLDRAAALARALRLTPPSDRRRLYWACRVCLLSDVGQVPAFDAVLAALLGGAVDVADRRGDPTAPALPTGEHREVPGQREVRGPEAGGVGAAAASMAQDGAKGPAREAVLAAVSAQERLSHTAFADLTDDEVVEVRRLVRRLRLATPERRTRRTRASSRPGERLDLRRTLGRARRSGGDPVRLVHRHRRTRPRRLVLLCDVSGSMESVTRVYLALLQGAVAGVHAEAFVFSTRLTRLTRALRGRDPDVALARAAASAPDWAGGTRLAGCLRDFLDHHGRRGPARGAVVVVLSDGWTADEPAEVARQMARLHRVAHRVVWVNPRKAAPGFTPLVGGMAAALPFCDVFVSGHSLAALDEVVDAVRSDRPRTRNS